MTKQELIENIKRKRSFLCVGLDTDLRKIPEHLMRTENPMLTFNRAIIDASVDAPINPLGYIPVAIAEHDVTVQAGSPQVKAADDFVELRGWLNTAGALKCGRVEIFFEI